MAAIGVSFRWLDILEKEFDKAYVDLELLIGDMESEELELVYPARQKMATLSSCFAQLAHKAQTVFQNSAKIEAELVNLRAELVEARAARQSLEEELHVVLLQLHASQLQQQGSGAHGGALGGAQGTESEAQRILTRLQGELERSSPRHARHQLRVGSEAREAGVAVEAERAQLERENAALRQSLLALQSEVSGARLAAKYLDKELAGRIQQLQLFGRDMKTDLRNKLWRQLEAEILLQRHKTVVRACRLNSQYQQQQRLNNINNNGQAALGALSTPGGYGASGPGGPGALSVPSGPDAVPIAVEQPIIRTVTIARQPGEGLGMSVTGGREHGVPILISELEADGPAARTNALYVGDAILAVNRVDLRQAGHKEAVALLSSHPGDVTLEVQFLASAEDSEDDNSLMGGDLENYRYRFFDEEVLAPGESIDLYPGYLNANGNDSGAVLPTPTAPRTPDSRNASEASFSASPVFSAAKLSTIAVEVPTSVSESEASPLHEQPDGGGGGCGTGGGEGDSEEVGPGTRIGGVAGEDSDNSAARGFSVASIQRILRTLTSASPATSPSPSVSPSASPSASPATSTPVSPERRLKTHPGFAAPALRPTREEPAVNSHASARVPTAPPRQTFQTLDNESFTRSGEDGTQEIYRFRKPISDESQSEKMSDSGIAVTASGGSASGSTSAYGGAATYNHNKPKQTKKRSKRSTRKGAGLGLGHPHPHALSDGAVSSPDSLYFKGRFVPSDAVLMDSLGDPDFGTPV